MQWRRRACGRDHRQRRARLPRYACRPATRNDASQCVHIQAGQTLSFRHSLQRSCDFREKIESDGHETSEANVLYLMNVAVNQGLLIPMDAAVKVGSRKGLHWIS